MERKSVPVQDYVTLNRAALDRNLFFIGRYLQKSLKYANRVLIERSIYFQPQALLEVRGISFLYFHIAFLSVRMKSVMMINVHNCKK